MVDRRVLPWLATAILALAACSSQHVAPVREAAVEPPAFHVVNTGETLYSIAWRYGQDYREVARWNGIGPPYRIFPGQRLRLRRPGPADDAGRSAKAGRAAAPRPAPTVRPPPARAGDSAATEAPAGGAPAAGRWTWPARGRVVRSSGGPKRGIDILGEPGSAIRAAAAGEVVYAGNGLLRYGNLVILKHDDVFFSAYAHASALLVAEGQRVTAGQRIARMGSTGAPRTMLHFEIRRNGRPVDPLRYLPPYPGH